MREREVDRLIRRSRDLFALASEHTRGKTEEVVAGVICNACGKAQFVRAPTRDALEAALPLALEGWTITAKATDSDLCPDCTAAQAK